MTEGRIKVTGIKEHENGSATYKFKCDADTKEFLAELGIEFTLHCAAYGWDIQDALDHLEREVPKDD